MVHCTLTWGQFNKNYNFVVFFFTRLDFQWFTTAAVSHNMIIAHLTFKTIKSRVKTKLSETGNTKMRNKRA